MTDIRKFEVINAQKAWSDGLIYISYVYKSGGDYITAARDFIKKHYAFDDGKMVLFKPTLAAQKQFRTTFDAALSYFIGGNSEFPEDHGFALKPWIKVEWEPIGILIFDQIALAMGNYYFTPEIGTEKIKVEFSFAYIRDSSGNLKIILHDSHLPYHAEVFV